MRGTRDVSRRGRRRKILDGAEIPGDLAQPQFELGSSFERVGRARRISLACARVGLGQGILYGVKQLQTGEVRGALCEPALNPVQQGELRRLNHGAKLCHHGFAPDWSIIRSLFRFGLPTGIQGIMMNIGGFFMLKFIGSVAHGAEAQAVYAVSYNELFSFITWTSTGLLGAAAAIAGQNLGAGNPERASDAVHAAARIGLTGAATLGLFFLFIPRVLLGIFGMRDPVVVDIGVHLLRVLSVSGLFITVALTYTGGLQGTGDTKGPLWISIVSQMFVPLGICFVISLVGTLEPMHIWLAILAGHATRCALSVSRFNQGKWRAITVDIAAERGAA